MRIIKALLAGAALSALSFACVAQEEEGSEMFTYATYYECGGGPLSVPDEVIADDAERMNGLVDDGTIAHWGWLAHHTGGNWQRVSYFQADSLDALLDAGDAIVGGDDDDADADADADAAADDADDGPTFGSVCNRHDDYIWQVENGNGSDDRGAVGFSVYLVCDSSREERADEIVDAHVAPILNGLVEDGSLTSWGWSSHVVGGRFRRLQTMTATDHKTMLAARGKAIDAIYADDNSMGVELDDICGAHVDYMWNIISEK
jgi:hypothetical protein